MKEQRRAGTEAKKKEVGKMRFSQKGVIPAEAGIQCFQRLLDAGSSLPRLRVGKAGPARQTDRLCGQTLRSSRS